MILSINAGSSSLKYASFYDDGQEQYHCNIEQTNLDAAFLQMFYNVGDLQPDVVAHRFVHGGRTFKAPTIVTPEVYDALDDLCHLAPQHNPKNLIGIEYAMEEYPDAVHVAVFDTAFHATIPEHAYRYAISDDWYHNFGMRRYGFHGISHQYMKDVAESQLGFSPNLITVHLGNGCSASAIRLGKCIDTTMGYSPLSGLVMGTRSGDIDPLLVLEAAEKFGVHRTRDMLQNNSGLKGLCGTNDMREILARASASDEKASLATDVYCYTAAKAIGSFAAILPIVDAIVFSGGIGENSPAIRAKILDMVHPKPPVIVVKADEEKAMAQQAMAALK
jgi:acetate kinase